MSKESLHDLEDLLSDDDEQEEEEPNRPFTPEEYEDVPDIGAA